MSNILSIPNAFLTMFNLVLVTFASEAYNNRWLISTIENLWFLPFFIALRAIGSDITPWGYFALATLVLGYPYVDWQFIAWSERLILTPLDRYMQFRSAGFHAMQDPSVLGQSPRQWVLIPSGHELC